MKISISTISVTIIFVSTPHESTSFLLQTSPSRMQGPATFRPSPSSTRLPIASMDRKSSDSHPSKIDNELSSAYNPRFSSDTQMTDELHSILDDGHGHINSDLARSIWQWENARFHSNSDDPYPAKRLKYSTRDGLRLVDSIARKVNRDENRHRHSDLVQEGVVALMRCTVLWDEQQQFHPLSRREKKGGDKEEGGFNREAFEAFAKQSIETAMKKLLDETTDHVEERMEVNLDLLKKRSMDQERRMMGHAKQQQQQQQQSFAKEYYAPSQLIQPLNEALEDANPTPDEIALSDMIRHDIGEFLVRQLSEMELKVVRLRFGLEKNLGTSLTTEEMSVNLGIDCEEVLRIEEAALAKLKASFEDDYIGAYIDDDHTNEVSV